VAYDSFKFKPFGSKRQHVNTKFLLTHGLPCTGCMVKCKGDELVVRAYFLLGVARNRKGPGDKSE
jgi:hypothetical protein